MARDFDEDEDNAPWLAEGVREKRPSTLVPRGRLVGGALLFIALLVLVGLGIYVISARKQDGSSGFKRAEDAPLITADTGSYKVAPADPGGATVTGPSDMLSAASSGDDPGGAIDTTAVAEEPVARPGAVPPPAAEEPTDLLPPPRDTPPVKIAPAPVIAPVARPIVKPVETPKAAPPKMAEPAVKPPKPESVAKPADAPAKTGNASLQLGAFSSAAKADAAWTAVVARAPYLAGLGKRVDPLERDGKTLYRLRAGGVASKAAATDFCARLKAGGDACLVAE